MVLSRAQIGVGGELGVVAAYPGQPQRASDEHAGDPGGTRRAHVDRVEGAVGERLHGGGQAGYTDRECRA
ncbi:MAG TPA: hypothetical protein VII53_11005 [Solirubrobacteraceae bacterium]